jgi:hypothetical protein
VLVAQQLLGRAILVQAKPHQNAGKERVAARIIAFLHPLFPHADPENLHKKVSELLSEAIDLANLMTEEQSIFSVTMIGFGWEFSGYWMEAPEEQLAGPGRVAMCTFPLFGVSVPDPVRGEHVCQVLVKAEVELKRLGD